MKENGYALFAFEGADGVGKSSLSKEVTRILQSKGIVTEYFSFPGKDSNRVGKLVYDLHHNLQKYNIDNINQISLQLLHIASHIDLITNEIIPALESGMTVILDRFWWSTYIYGKLNNIELWALETMVNLEQKIWGAYLPSTLFLISTSEPYRKEYDIDFWNKICYEYKNLSSQEKDEYTVIDIHNSSFEKSLDKIINEIEVRL